MLLIEQLTVFIYLDFHAVREIRIAVVLFELGVFHPKIHVAIHSRDPAQHRIIIDGRVSESLADR